MKRRGREEGKKDGGKANIKVRQEEQGSKARKEVGGQK